MFKKGCFIGWLLLSALPAYASFIESTVGAAVVNDATATYFNPSALTGLKNLQLIGLGSMGTSQTQFSGQFTQLGTGLTQSGTANSKLNYVLPSFYLGVPTTKKLFLGLAVVGNNFNRDIEGYSILRYAQSNNQVQDIDIVPAFGFKLNKFISIGASVNYSSARFVLEPIFGAPSLNIPDSQSHNDSSGTGWAGDVGLLIRPAKTTLIGLNYRSAISYRMRGTSTYNGASHISSPTYRFDYWTPARSVLSINQFVTSKIALIGTIQYIEWSIFKDVRFQDIATPIGIVSSASSHYNFKNSWLLTLGSNYRISSKWIVRVAGSYTQAPSNGTFQIDNGDTLTTGGSMGYAIFEHIIIDCSYAHAFIKSQNIHVTTAQNSINGINKSAVNSVALKITVNV